MRTMRIVPACGVMMTCYEMIKKQFAPVYFHEKEKDGK
jgi:hypothetical protein